MSQLETNWTCELSNERFHVESLPPGFVGEVEVKADVVSPLVRQLETLGYRSFFSLLL